MTVETFIANYNGKEVKSPHGILGQCVSVPSEYAVLNGWPELFGSGDGTALEIWNNGVSGYQKIANTPAGVPSAGDFVFFGSAYGGGAGHTGIVVSGNTSEVTLFEQNDPLGSAAHEKVYNYTDLLGWFHFPVAVQELVEAVRETNVRSAPNTTSTITSVLQAGQTFESTGVVSGQVVTEDGVTSGSWYHSTAGHYVWSGNCKVV